MENSQIILTITGSPAYIQNELLRLANEIDDQEYNKPMEGLLSYNNGTSSINVPAWNKEPQLNHIR